MPSITPPGADPLPMPFFSASAAVTAATPKPAIAPAAAPIEARNTDIPEPPAARPTVPATPAILPPTPAAA